MKRINLLELALPMLLLLGGCSASDSDGMLDREPATATSGSAIVFGVADFDSTTRRATRTAHNTMTLDGSGEYEASLSDNGFGVFACHTGLHPYVSFSTVCNFMYNQKVVCDPAGVWTYSPQLYWPIATEGLEEYITFFAYAPYTNVTTGQGASQCIVDMSLPSEAGDPWILYQLGGTETDWQSAQVDLLYDFQSDCHRTQEVGSKVEFDFKHALASAGDVIGITLGETTKASLRSFAAAAGSNVTLTVTKIDVDYLLTRKGRLVLNNNSSPNWQAVGSEDQLVHRKLSLTPNHVLASATAEACTVTDYQASNQGIFYIPLDPSDGSEQQVTLTITYTQSNDPSSLQTRTTTIPLSSITEPNKNRNLSIVL